MKGRCIAGILYDIEDISPPAIGGGPYWRSSRAVHMKICIINQFYSRSSTENLSSLEIRIIALTCRLINSTLQARSCGESGSAQPRPARFSNVAPQPTANALDVVDRTAPRPMSSRDHPHRPIAYRPTPRFPLPPEPAQREPPENNDQGRPAHLPHTQPTR